MHVNLWQQRITEGHGDIICVSCGQANKQARTQWRIKVSSDTKGTEMGECRDTKADWVQAGKTKGVFWCGECVCPQSLLVQETLQIEFVRLGLGPSVTKRKQENKKTKKLSRRSSLV